MKYFQRTVACLTLFCSFFTAFSQLPEVQPKAGMIIRSSCKIAPGTYFLPAPAADIFAEGGTSCSPVITIEGSNIEVDFARTQWKGAKDITRPDLFTGVAILVKGENITIRNAKINGYKVAMLAENCPGLRVIDSDFSWNYRPRLYSGREHEAFSDWLSYHQNEKDEWLRYGAGIYLKNCREAEVKACTITGNQNALLLTGCDNGRFWNNTFQFNSGLGIGLYRCNNNKVMHNRADWNVRGSSLGFYQRGQDSAGILVYEQSSNNTIAFNSATHSGDGLFLWAGQTTMDSGAGGCNDNLIFGNDFSYAPTNGVEVTFSRNTIRGNLIRSCNYGIWGGYSYETQIIGNLISDCKTAIAIEHGQSNIIKQNLLQDDTLGVYLWANVTQPNNWGYAKNHDTRSRNNIIDRNVFMGVQRPLRLSATENTAVNGENLFYIFQTLLETPQPNDSLVFLRNDIYTFEKQAAGIWQNPAISKNEKLNFTHFEVPEDVYAPLEMSFADLNEPDSLEGGILAALPAGFPQGKQFIIMEEWGPYNFRRPVAVMDTIAGNLISLTLLGPSGDWKITGMKGVKSVTAQKGIIPEALIVERDPNVPGCSIQFSYNGPETVTTAFGEKVPPGSNYPFEFRFFDQKLDWKMQFYNYNTETGIPDMAALLSGKPVLEQQTNELWMAWWGAPAPGVNADQFATVSTSRFTIPKGKYTFTLTSDDGVRLYLDGKLLLDRWDIHEPATDRLEVELNGQHDLRIEHFDATGFGTLDFRISE